MFPDTCISSSSNNGSEVKIVENVWKPIEQWNVRDFLSMKTGSDVIT